MPHVLACVLVTVTVTSHRHGPSHGYSLGHRDGRGHRKTVTDTESPSLELERSCSAHIKSRQSRRGRRCPARPGDDSDSESELDEIGSFTPSFTSFTISSDIAERNTLTSRMIL
jgi:hypothetical protein